MPKRRPITSPALPPVGKETETERVRREAEKSLAVYDLAYRRWLEALVSSPVSVPSDAFKLKPAVHYENIVKAARKKADITCGTAMIAPHYPQRRSLVLQGLEVATRLLLAPIVVPGLTGGARVKWIEFGLSSSEQLKQAVARRRTEIEEDEESRRDRLRLAGQHALANAPALRAEARARSGKAVPARALRAGTGPKELAETLGVEPRKLRAFLRSLDMRAPYDFTPEDVKTITKKWKEQ